NGNEKWQGKLFSSTYWLPIIPLFYHSSHAKEGRHTNLLWLIDWHRNKDDNLDRLWLMPFLFDRPGENGYRHILLPLYISTRSWTGENYRHLLPLLYFSWRSIDNSSGHSEGDKYNDSLLSLLYCSFNKYNSDEKWEGEPYSSTSWFPVIPLFFRSSHAENGRHTNLLWLIDWKSDKKDNLSRFWFIPFIFHQTCDQGYRYYAPFYMRPSGNTEEQGLSFGLFHYHKWSLKKSVLWASLYFSMDKPVKKEHYIHFLPVFWTWKFKKSSGTIIIPWSITYEDKKRSVYINLLGFSKSAVLGPLNPDVDLEIGTYKGRFYLDTDTSWLYDVISFSTRISFKKPWGNDDDISVADLAERDDLSGTGEENSLEIQKPGLRSKREFDRENSEFFWGWKVLFGWMAYESGDSKRHFRLLPLSWFTWDKNSTDKLYTVPIAFLYYKSEDNALEYFALFPGFVPLFGYQIDRNSYKYGILLNSLWIEYDAEEDLDEITVLWPFINWYTSSKRSGWRVFPTFWYKKYLEDDLTISRYILLPLHYSRYERNKDGNVINEFVINPLYYSKRTTDESGSSGTTMFPILPLYYSSYEKTVYSYANKSLYEDEAEKSITGRSVKYITNEFSTVLGLFYMNDKTIVTEDGKEDKDSRFFLFGYYSHNSASINESSFLFGLVKSAEYPQKKKSEFELLYGLFSTSSSGEESKMHLMPFYYNYESPEKHELYLLLGLYWNTDYLIEEESNFYLFYGLYSSFHYQTSRYVFMQSVHKRVKVSTSEKWIIPLYYYEGDDGLDKEKYTLSTHIFWLWYWNSESFTREESKEELYTTTMWFPVIPLFYRHSSNTEIHWNLLGIIDRKISENYSRFCVFPLWYNSLDSGESRTNILGLIDWKCNKNEDLIRFWFLPIYLGYPGEESHHFIFPLLAYFGRSPKESTTLILGTYWHSSESYERQNILYLYDHKRYNKYDEDSYRFLLGTIHYETSPEVTEWDMLFGLLVDYKGYNNTHNYKFEFLKYISTWKRDDDYFQNSILPLWYYKEDSDSWSLLSPIGLSYLSEDQSGDFDLGLLGVLYYRNNIIYENEDTMAVLGGALYWERRKPERGYHSYGSLWGILLDYETESETGFKKLSILKGLYKRVEMNGEVKQKFLWIF
ncbi:MAG: hypothetical protein GY863_22010, partial [bacterium]|nr:hypothetical protein [bacterium]